MTSPYTPPPQNVLRGIVLYALAVLTVVAMSSFAKLASGTYRPIEIVFYRNIFILALLLPWMAATKSWDILRTQRPGAHIVRGLVGTLSVTLVFYAYKYLPVADATALIYAAPLIVAALSGPFLGESVGPYRWTAIAVGFAGVLVMAQPAGDGGLAGYGFGLCGACTIAAVSLCLRGLGKTENPMTTVFYFTLIGTLATGLFMPFGGHWLRPDTLPVLGIVGITGFLQQVLKTKAMSLAPAATLSPLQFTGLVWGALFGFVLFGDWPTPRIQAGAGIIVASNLFILWREKRKKAQAGAGSL